MYIISAEVVIIKTENNAFDMLEMMDRPGFFAENGVIIYVNTRGKQLLIPHGTAVSTLLHTGNTEYSNYSGGCLYLTLTIEETTYEATVTKMGSYDLFLLENTPSSSELKALSLAATHLRQPLADIMLAAEGLIEQEADTEQLSLLNRGLFRLLRTISNMSDASEAMTRVPNLQTLELCAEFEEVLEQASALIQSAGIHLEYTLPTAAIYGQADKAMLSRAVYNLISNAAKYAPNGTNLNATLTRSGHLLYFSLSGYGDTATLPANPYTRFQREPGLEDIRNGIGLGLVLVKSFAVSHGGTVLMECRPDGNIRFTLTMEIRKNSDATVRTNLLRPDAYSGRNQGLIELSDVLPKDLYNGKY